MQTATASRSATASLVGTYRWRICALLFLALSINYVDRSVLGVLAPELQQKIGWDEIQYSNIVNAFQAAYAIGLLLAGRFMDRVGTRAGYTSAIGLWSLATIATALVRTVMGFGIVRALLGLGESGSFPAAVKTVAEWFPKKERALATGLFNCGTNVGAIVAPLAVPWLTVRYGWQSAFVVLGALSALWIIPWMIMYRRPQDHPRVSPSELAYIQADPPDPEVRIPWARLIRYRQTWAFVVAKSMTDPIWWFFLFWLPKFLNTQYGLSITAIGWPLVIIYNLATVGSIFGGWLPARFFRLGWSANRSRKTAMLLCAITVTPIMFAANAKNLWVAVALIGLATASHQGWSANVFTLPSDMFPRRAVGSVTGIGGFGGGIGGLVIATFTGFVLQFTGSYVPMFVIAGSVYLVSLLIVHLLVPNLEPADLRLEA
jgi:ACS family hexuronate transporter-like MFS transporter